MLKILFTIIFLFFSYLYAQTPVLISNLTEDFQSTIPTKLKGNLQLIEVVNRCHDCQPWRYINYYSNTDNNPIKKEKVSVEEGYRALYAYPNTHYFANVKIEKSVSNEYLHDKAIIIDALKHAYKRKYERINTYLKDNPALAEKMTLYKAKGKDYIEFHEDSYRGYKYIDYTENVIGLTSNTISQIHIFIPNKEMIISAYLLNQRKTKFKTIDEFLLLQHDFITSYIDYLITKEKK